MNISDNSFEHIVKTMFNSPSSIADELIVFEQEHLISTHILNPQTTPPMRVNARAFILCRYGEVSLSVNYTNYRLNRGSLLWLSNFQIVDKVHVKNNCQVIGVIMSQKFAESIEQSTPVAKKMLKKLKNPPEPVIKLEDDEVQTVTENMLRIKNYLTQTHHHFREHIIKNYAGNITMEVANIILKRVNATDSKTDKENRKDEIFRTFLQHLMKHYKEQHEVAYYANEQRMTPENLARSVIAASGKSPNQWISEALISEAKTLLRKPDAGIKQVADELLFSDQSSFGKFFKRHTGMTPFEYKNGEK